MITKNTVYSISRLGIAVFFSILIVGISSAEESANPTKTFTLSDAVQLTLEKNPTLQAFSSGVRVSEARLLQSGLRPNPELDIMPENFVGSGNFARREQYQNTIQLSQLIELGGKRRARIQEAEASIGIASREFESQRLSVLSDVAKEYLQVLADQEALKLAIKTRKQAEESLKSVAAKVSSGGGNGIEKGRAEIFLVQARINEEHEEHGLKASRMKLASFWQEKELSVSELNGELFSYRTLPSYEFLVEKLRSGPELKIAEAEQLLRRAEIVVAESKSVPNIRAGIGWRQGRDWDDQSAVAQLSIPLNIFDRNQGNIEAAKVKAERQTYETKSLTLKIEAALFALYQERLHAEMEMKTLVKEILPSAENILNAAKRGYQEGRFSQLELVDVQRTNLDVRRRYIEVALAYHELSLEIDRMIGGSI
jgi:cobalt-zinc-cadmium efflux system outer membrane protein